MGYSNLAPRTINITGADLTGSDGTADRTYTITDDSVLSSGLDVVINGTQLHEGAANDFTLAGETLTFLNIVDDTDLIRINYFKSLSTTSTSSVSTSSNLRYSSTEQLANVLGIKKDVPSWDTASSPTNETVGAGDDSETVFYLDHKNIIAETYTLYYGSSASTTDELTETTHYTLNLTTGKITLTAAGVTLVSTANIYAAYSYFDNNMSDAYLTQVLRRAEQQVDNVLNTTFTDATQDNPSFSSAIELQFSEGAYQQLYFPFNKPLKDVESTLDGDLTAAATSIPVATGEGANFPSTGYICIGTEVISYTGISTDTLTGCTRGALGSTAATHTDADEIHTTILQLSGTAQGSTPTWQTQAWHSDFVAQEDHIYIYKEILSTNQSAGATLLSQPDVQNRVRLVYLYGHDTVPTDITRLTLLFAKKQLIGDTVTKALVAGRNEFNPELITADSEETQRIIDNYRINAMLNV